MMPIRRESKRRVTQSPFDSRLDELQLEQSEHAVDDAGGIDSQHAAVSRPGVCGCLKEPGGYCAACGNLSCVACHGHCLQCHKPICPRDSHFPNGVADRETRMCADCWSTTKRRGLLRGLGRILLSPFVQFEDRSHG